MNAPFYVQLDGDRGREGSVSVRAVPLCILCASVKHTNV
jgi:hypothetical protein